jgi:hypothetical protein
MHDRDYFLFDLQENKFLERRPIAQAAEGRSMNQSMRLTVFRAVAIGLLVLGPGAFVAARQWEAFARLELSPMTRRP